MTTSTPSCPTTNNGVPFGSQPGFPNGFVQNTTPGYIPGAYGPTPGVPTGSPVNTANINEATPSTFVPGFNPGAYPTNFYPTNFVNTWSWNTPFNYGFYTPFNSTFTNQFTPFNTAWYTPFNYGFYTPFNSTFANQFTPYNTAWNTPFNYGFNTPFNSIWNTAFNTGWNTFQQPPFFGQRCPITGAVYTPTFSNFTGQPWGYGSGNVNTWNNAFGTPFGQNWNTLNQSQLFGHTCPITGNVYTPSTYSNISGQPIGFGSWPVNTWNNAFNTPFAYQNAATNCCTPWSNTGTPNFIGTTNPFAFGPYNFNTPFNYGWNTPFNFGSSTPFTATQFSSNWTNPFWYQNSFQTTPTSFGYTPFTGPFNTGYNTPFNFGVPSFGYPTNTFAGVDLKDKCSPRGFGLIRDAA